MSPDEKKPRVFLSYSWDDEPHCIWVRHFAERLVHFGLDVRLDQWHAQYGDDLSQFMEQEVSKADFVVAVCTPKFAQRANERIGGAGYEQQIITADVVTGRLKGSVIPVRRSGDLTAALPTYLKGTKAIDLRDDARLAEAAEDVARKVFNRPRYAPPTPAFAPELPTQTRTPLPGSLSPRVASSAHHEKEELDKGAAIEEAHFVKGERKLQATAGDKVRGEKDEQGKTERRVPVWIWVASVALLLVAAFAAKRMTKPQPSKPHQEIPAQIAPTAQPQAAATAQPQAAATWTDSATGLMWTKKDNGSDISWHQASNYCKNLQLAGFSGWRLATIDELQGIYDPNANADRWHVKGELQLSGWQWSSSPGKGSGEAWQFDFQDWARESVPRGNGGLDRALCVRRMAKIP
jgi:hypothetical protein